MLSVQIAVFGDHFRLNPDTELYAGVIYAPDQLAKRTAQLFFIHAPVSQPAVVIIPFPEPAIVHHDHVDTKFRRARCQLQNCLPCKIKISGFPAVKQYGPCLSAVLSSANMLPDTAMVPLRQLSQPAAGVGQNRLRNDQLFFFRQRIMEVFALQSHNGPCLVILVFFRLEQKISTVNKYHTIASAIIFRCTLLCKNDRRIILMARCASAAPDRITAMHNLCTLQITLHRMSSIKAEQLIVACKKIQT